jgi:hypothetical protein
MLRINLRISTQIGDGGIWLEIVTNYPSGMRLG